MILTTTEGQQNLPRYFSQVFERARQLNKGRLDFVLPDGRVFRAKGRNPGLVSELHLHDEDVFVRLIREGGLGFCDSYLDRGWSSPDLQAFLDMLLDDNAVLSHGFSGSPLLRSWERLRHLLRANSRRQARRNIAHHYDLGNDFYALWLDESMTYSSAYFKSGQEDLEKAQENKYALLLEHSGARPGDHLLEIGCGWGGFAEFAGKRGVKVTGLTISQAQYDYARARMQRAGLSELVEIRLQDYRDVRGQYDAIASIEMFEAVGEKYWPTYFNRIAACLRPGARASLQIITLNGARFDAYRKGVDFIQKYIFPGGMLPSGKVLYDQVARAGLAWRHQVSFGDSYSQTLRRWHATFNARWPEIAALGYDARFGRMWNFYLASCAAGFRSGNCDVVQVTIEKPA